MIDRRYAVGDALGQRVELRNARLVDVAAGRYLPAGTSLVLSDGRIEALSRPTEPSEGSATPPADVVIDLDGLTVLPGLINTHCHVQMNYPSMLVGIGEVWLVKEHGPRQIERRLADCLAHGVTQVRDALTTDLRQNRVLRTRIGRGEIAGPRIRQCVYVGPAGGPFATPHGPFEHLVSFFSGTPLVGFADPNCGVVTYRANATEREVRDAVDRAIDERGAEYVKLYDQRRLSVTYRLGTRMSSDPQLIAAADQARRRGLRTTMHHTTIESFRRGVRAGVDSLVHLPLDGRLTERDVRDFAATGGAIEPTMSLAYYLAWPWSVPNGAANPRTPAVLGRLAALREATYREVSEDFYVPGLAASARGHFERAAAGRARVLGLLDLSVAFRYWGRALTNGAANLRALRAAGVVVGCGNDAGAVPAGEAMIGIELATLALALADGVDAAGVPFDGAAALRAATLDSARALGVERDYGSLDVGKVADLAVVRGDPLAEPGVVGGRVAALFLDGRLVVDEVGLRGAA